MASPRRQLKNLKIHPKKSLGQHFVQDPNILRKVIEVAGVEGEDIVLEIGAGLGSLTFPLAERAKKVYALEIDGRLAGALKELFSGTERVEVIQADALQLDFRPLSQKWGQKMKVVSNLPYEISSPMIFRLLKEREFFSLLVLMLQLEVARRIVAQPGTRDYGALSLYSQLYSHAAIAFSVGPKAFHPPPRVESAVVKFEILPRPRIAVDDEGNLHEVIRSAFAYRRKTLARALQLGSFSQLSREEILNALKTSQVPPMARGETLTLEQFEDLARALKRAG